MSKALYPPQTAVRHIKSNTYYVVLMTPDDGLMLEGVCKPAYAYQRFNERVGTSATIAKENPYGLIWVREQGEMEDGRFEVVT